MGDAGISIAWKFRENRPLARALVRGGCRRYMDNLLSGAVEIPRVVAILSDAERDDEADAVPRLDSEDRMRRNPR